MRATITKIQNGWIVEATNHETVYFKGYEDSIKYIRKITEEGKSHY